MPAQDIILLAGLPHSGIRLAAALLENDGVHVDASMIEPAVHSLEALQNQHALLQLQHQLAIHLREQARLHGETQPLGSNWQLDPVTQHTAQQLYRLAATLSKQVTGSWALGDIETCLFLPLWREIATRLNRRLRLILCVRNPHALLRAHGFQSERNGQRYWHICQANYWSFHRQALLEAECIDVQVISFEQWFGRHCDHQLIRLLDSSKQRNPTEQATHRFKTLIAEAHTLMQQQLAGPSWTLVHPKCVQLHQRLDRIAIRQSNQTDWARLRQWLTSQPQSLSPQREELRRLHNRVQRRFAISSRLRQLIALRPVTNHQLINSPWNNAIRALAHSPRAQRRLLWRWRLRGGPNSQELMHLDTHPSAAAKTTTRPLPTNDGLLPLVVLGGRWNQWGVHAWIQHLPIPLGRCFLWNAQAMPNFAKQGGVVLHLQELDLTIHQGRLEKLIQASIVLDPDPRRVALLQTLGVPAELLVAQPSAQNAWLSALSGSDLTEANLGLPSPQLLQSAPDQEQCTLVLGPGGPRWDDAHPRGFWEVPGFDELIINGSHDARELAWWLDCVHRSGLQLVRFKPQPWETAQGCWSALQHPDDPADHWQNAQLVDATLTPQELLKELDWRRQGKPDLQVHPTPEPPLHIAWEYDRGGKPQASICVSLYNYANTICEALDSALNQTQDKLELLIVDDASSDQSVEAAHNWLKQHGSQFEHAALVQHRHNGGLAAARNTAFKLARADWCFVLDADNTLHPEALKACLAIAKGASNAAAVVHPLIEANGQRLYQEKIALLCGVSWQRQGFLHGNIVDAMALVRRQAWQHVGGYAHIEGGWEDFDLWCLLIEAGYHGVLCPQRLATYNIHESSMISQSTLEAIPKLSRLLQKRHPWLCLI